MKTSPAPQLDGFELIRELGSGGYSDVFLFAQRSPRREVAVKVLRSDALTSQTREQITATAEVDAMALADHPYIVPVFEAGIAADGRPYIVMKYYPRPDYATRARTDRFSVVDVLRTGVQIACAVETAHRAGILHRDIKPGNILTDAYGNPGLADFGIAVASGLSSADSEGLSVPWAPPEVIFGTARQGAYSDIYSLTATLWHLLVGRSPFEVPGGDNSTVALMGRIRTMAPPATGRGDVPPSLERLLRMGLAKEPGNRPKTAADLARALQAIEQEQRLPLTPLVLIDPNAERFRPRTEGEDRERTHMRSAQIVDPHPPPAAPRPNAEPTRGRPQVISDVPSATVNDAVPAPRPQRERAEAPRVPLPETHRVVRPAATESAVEQSPQAQRMQTGLGRRIGLVVIGFCVVAAVVIAIVLSQGKKAAGNTSPPSNPPTIPLPSAVAPGTPTVAAKRLSATKVEFRWHYPGSLSSDTFRWFRSGSGAGHGTSTKPELVVSRSRNSEVCLKVQAIRRDGTLSELSDPACNP